MIKLSITAEQFFVQENMIEVRLEFRDENRDKFITMHSIVDKDWFKNKKELSKKIIDHTFRELRDKADEEYEQFEDLG